MNVLISSDEKQLFGPDIAVYDSLLGDIVKESRFLVEAPVQLAKRLRVKFLSEAPLPTS